MTSDVQLNSLYIVSPIDMTFFLSSYVFFSLSGLYALIRLLALMPLTENWYYLEFIVSFSKLI